MTEHKRTPQGEARAAAQRERILVAAQTCFAAHGFHAASITTICDAAQMSAGLIYRYFKNKDEIILAIIERQLQEARASIAALKSSSDLVALMNESISRWRSGVFDSFNPVLFLEMSALASRDLQIAKALMNTDRVLDADMRDWLTQAARNQGHELSGKDVQQRQLALQCFIEGLFVRSVRDPELDPHTLAESLESFFMYLRRPPDPSADGT